MILETSIALTNANIAAALAKGVKYAKTDKWLATVKVHAMQRRPAEGLQAWEDGNVIAKPFTFRFELAGKDGEAGKVWALDEARLAKGMAKLAASNAPALGRIAQGKATVADAQEMLQLCLFGRIAY